MFNGDTMSFEKEMILDELKKHKQKISISRLHNLVKPMPYYLVKLEYIPELEKEGLIIITKVGKHTYIQLNKKHNLK